MKPSQLNTSFGAKLALVLGLIFASAAYALWQPFANPVVAALTAENQPVQTVPAPAVLPVPKPKSTSQYIDGTYTGSPENAYYGTVQVQAVVQNGKLADVTFLSYPSDRSTSRMISARAMSVLTSEAIQVQSANVNGVSGASDTSAAFTLSLGTALEKAKN